MIEIYKTVEERLEKISAPCDGCWINVVNPTSEEKKELEKIGILPEFIKASLDEEESSHIDYDDDYDQRLIVIDYPICLERKDGKEEAPYYTTVPLSIVSFKGHLVTISLHENEELNDFKSGKVKGINTNLKTRFFLQLMLRISQRYLVYLRQIDRLSTVTEQKLHQSMQNRELVQMLGLEKSLVYFSTSLKSTEIIMNKIMRGKVIPLYEDDQDLLEDVLIEVHQAIEMCNIYSNILSGTMDAFASVISNNLNIVMKVLAVVTIVMSIPNIVFSFYGMNVDGGLPGDLWYIPLIITLLCCLVAIIIFKKKNMFK